MEDEDAELQFHSLWEKRQQNLRGLIVVSGLPRTYKTRLTYTIGNWAKCPILCIDHFFCNNPKAATNTQVKEEEEEVQLVQQENAFTNATNTQVKEEGEEEVQLVQQQNAFTNATNTQVKEEEEEEEEVQLVQQQNAFTNLCEVARFHIRMTTRLNYKELLLEMDSTLVIKSRLNTTFELQQLLQLVTDMNVVLHRKFPLLIIESRVVSDFSWKLYFESIRKDYDTSNYRGPRTWKEMEKVRDDYYHPQSQLAPPNWDLFLQQQLISSNDIVVRRLLIDTYYDFSSLITNDPKRNVLFDAITFLFNTPQQEFMNISRNPYTVELCELRPYLLEKRLRNTLARIGRSQYPCSSGDSIFAELAHDINGVCGVCEELIDSHTESAAYACRLCILTLHKSCAERIDFKAVQDLALRYIIEDDLKFDSYIIRWSAYSCCKSCIEKGKGLLLESSLGCSSCMYQTHLKSSILPTIVNHKFHPHFLSLMLNSNSYHCKACGRYAWFEYSYCCRKCGVYYHITCTIMPLELLNHKHGGHEHVMKLISSREHHYEESYWCDICYKDMDPQEWLYSCHDCPYYSAHTLCACGHRYLKNIQDARFVQQLQSQLEDVRHELSELSHKE